MLAIIYISCRHQTSSRYHSREAVVISALQVEKNPITTPGPFSTPPLSRHIIIPPPVLPPNYHSTPPPGLRDFASTPPPSLYSYGYGTGGTLTGSLASSSCMGSPAFRHSPRPHSSSPKMKLRFSLINFFLGTRNNEAVHLLAWYSIYIKKEVNKLSCRVFLFVDLLCFPLIF